MAFSHIVQFAFLLVLSVSLINVSDANPLQDFCVADNTSPVFVNGVACKNPSLVTADDFTFSGLDKPGNTNNKQGLAVNLVTVDQFPALNTFGVTVERLDFAPKGLNSPHSHPRATEVLTIIKGTLYVGFITTDNKLFSKVLNKGDLFVFPIGLVHFQYNVGDCDVEAFSVLSSQNPGVVRISNSLFGANPEIPDDILAKAFMLVSCIRVCNSKLNNKPLPQRKSDQNRLFPSYWLPARTLLPCTVSGTQSQSREG